MKTTRQIGYILSIALMVVILGSATQYVCATHCQRPDLNAPHHQPGQNRVPGFHPNTHGLHMSNTWANIPLLNIPFPTGDIPIGSASNGLCGGMVFAVRDYFEAGVSIPNNTENPTSGPLFDYLVTRLFDSFDIFGYHFLPVQVFPILGAGGNGPVWFYSLMLPLLPNHNTYLPLFCILTGKGRAWITIEDAWPGIRDDIDNGRLSPLLLIGVISLDPFRLGEQHQVLAYGYSLTENQDLTILIYDPNFPDNENTITLNIGDPEHTTFMTSSSYGDFFLFERMNYTFSQPPIVQDEICNNGVDDDFDGLTDCADSNCLVDRDRDGFRALPCGTDCDDNNSNIHPLSPERCNRIDDNCNGQIDEGLPTNTFYRDADGDGYGNPNNSTQDCRQLPGYVSNNQDCNDNNSSVNPGMIEVCNGIDDNCDGRVDEGNCVTPCLCPVDIEDCISGRVTNRSGRPLAGKTVVLEVVNVVRRCIEIERPNKPPIISCKNRTIRQRVSSRTDDGGCYQLEPPLPPEDDVTIIISRKGTVRVVGCGGKKNVSIGGHVNGVNFRCR